MSRSITSLYLSIIYPTLYCIGFLQRIFLVRGYSVANIGPLLSILRRLSSRNMTRFTSYSTESLATSERQSNMKANRRSVDRQVIKAAALAEGLWARWDAVLFCWWQRVSISSQRSLALTIGIGYIVDLEVVEDGQSHGSLKYRLVSGILGTFEVLV